MDIFGSSIDLMRLVFLFGAVAALVYKKKLGVTPGGVIVPGTLAGILFGSFEAFILVLISSVVCSLIYKLAFARFPLSKRWASLIIISISVTLGLATMAIAESAHVIGYEFLIFSLITPGLITISARNYGFGKVMFGALTVTALAAGVGLLLAALIPYEILSYLSVQLAAYTPLTLTNPYIVLPISLIISILVYYRYGLRGGGYLISPFLAAVLVNSPLQFALILAGVAISYLAMRLVQRYTLVIGLERFVLSLFCGYFVITLMDLLAVTVGLGDGYSPASLVLIIAIAVMTNDLCLQSPKETLKKGITPSMITSYVARLTV